MQSKSAGHHARGRIKTHYAQRADGGSSKVVSAEKKEEVKRGMHLWKTAPKVTDVPRDEPKEHAKKN